MNRRVNGVLTALMSLLTLPPTLAHEATHGLLAAPWAHELALVVDPSGYDAALGVDWHDDVPSWALWSAAYGPVVVGAVVGILGAIRLVSGGVPRQPTSLLTWGVLGIWWAIYVSPSADDHQTANARD